MEATKTIFELDLHEEMLVKDEDQEQVVVMRVPNGFLYKHYEPSDFTNEGDFMCTVQTFVPYEGGGEDEFVQVNS